MITRIKNQTQIGWTKNSINNAKKSKMVENKLHHLIDEV
ncbi:MAG: hypothetical protein MRERC_4c070 [Mycoplasmataceae bacterium RC_NB112A]|nr:MAG: hypothetical protein MRERC_4c070 [Mycoplasmataceae bacterium RC_NB112A]